MKRIAVILCGSGYLDGSEIRESVGTLWALSQHQVETVCFAPDAPQAEVVNCLTGQSTHEEKRNQLVEAARIARGQIRPLAELEPKEFHAVIIPGGFGAAKNLCTFALKGSQGMVIPEMTRILEGFHSAGKPIGAICIAPALVALVFKNQGFELTLGENGEAAQELVRLGHRHIVKKANDSHCDFKHRIVSTPAYMYDRAPLHEVFQGIQKLVQEVVRMA